MVFTLYAVCIVYVVTVVVLIWCRCKYQQTVATRDGKEPSLLEFGSVQVLPNIRVRSVRVLSSYGKMKVRFFVRSVRFCSVRFYAGSYPYLPSLHLYKIYIEYTVGLKKNPPDVSWHFSQTVGNLVQILFASYFSYLR